MAWVRVVRTIVTEKELVIYSIDRKRPQVLPLMHEFKRLISWVEQTLRIERVEIDDLEAVRAPDAQLRLQEVNRA